MAATRSFFTDAVWLFILLGYMGVSGQKSEPGMVFTKHPRAFIAPLGDEVNFECSLNLAAEKFVWRHRPLGSKDWRLIDSASPAGGKTSKHVVYFDDESKAGDYRCVAFYGIYTTRAHSCWFNGSLCVVCEFAGTSGLASNPARLTQARIERFVDRSDVHWTVPAGSNVPISCPVPTSVPEAIVQFFKDGSQIETLASQPGSGKVMILERARASDSGSYHCQANNYITSETFTSNHKTVLRVVKQMPDQAPYFIKQPLHEYEVERGKNVTLECFAIGYPIPQVTWTKLGSVLPSRSAYSANGLSISNVQPGDRGEYDCEWRNQVGQVKASVILTVVEAPAVLQPPRLSTFPEGGELELSCNASGQPPPKIEWLINGETLQPSKNLEIKGSNLYISLVEKRHAGIVQCVASNDYGSHSGYNFLKVSPKQHMGAAYKPRGGGGGGNNEHGMVGGVHKHTRGGGRRRGKNGKRKDRLAIMVPPNQPNITRLSDVSVMVRWSVPEKSGLPIQFFKVQYRELGQKPSSNSKQAKWMTDSTEIASHIRSFEVSDLQPDHTYRFRIAAVYSNNDNAVSPISVRFHLTRKNGFDTNTMPIPLLTHTEALGPTEIRLLWQNTNYSADIDGFYVYHRASTSAGDYIKTTVEGRNATNITIAHLQPDTAYEFKVQSFSVSAASEFSQILKQKTKKPATEAPPVRQPLPGGGNKDHSTVETVDSFNIYAIIGGIAGSCLLLVAVTAIGVTYKKSKQKQSREPSQDQSKPISNGRVLNGNIADSKINITSNPLAGLESSEDPRQQPKVSD
uniref:Interference hedgehog n=1 Tax=Trichogramma kaykai TaxID=54128 RepID=A0ABD2WU34_9HYME